MSYAQIARLSQFAKECFVKTSVEISIAQSINRRCQHWFEVWIYKFWIQIIFLHRYLQIPLFDAERCWAFAVQLKQEMDVDQRSRKKFHMLSKLRKALKHATLLDSLIRRTEKVLLFLSKNIFSKYLSDWCVNKIGSARL